MIAGNLIAKFSIDAKGFSDEINRINKNMVDNAKAFRKAALAVTAFSYAVLKTAKIIADTEGIYRRLRSATGSVEANAKAWVFLRETSNSLGVSLEDLAYTYGSLTAALKGTKIQAADVEQIFTAITQRAAILGMTSQRVRLTFLAIEQMGSKGVIAMEELRRQFGEQIPGAMAIFSRSLNITQSQRLKSNKTL